MDRIILHIDANSFYASVECLYNPDIRHLPVVVGGDPEARHGIILTKNQIAKRFGIQTGEAIWQAKEKCPNLVVLKPNYPLYLHFSNKLRKIYEEYTFLVESFGLDECWLDISHPNITWADGIRIANEIRNRIREELGITVSVGVSFNKVFAKLGSDMKKPDATTVISLDDFREKVWPLPVGDLLYVGPKTTVKFHQYLIETIGDLATNDPKFIRDRFGKNGSTLQYFAQGKDRAPVMAVGTESAIKSIGNSSTAPHDMTCLDDVRCMLYLLSESVGARLRENGFKSGVVSISVRTTDLLTYSCQRVIRSTNLTDDIAKMGITLFKERYMSQLPLRSIGITCGSLIPDTAPVQLDLLGDDARREKAEALERALDGLRKRYGHQVIQRGVVLSNRMYAQVNPKNDHTIHPVSYYGG